MAMPDHSTNWQPRSSPPSLSPHLGVPTMCQPFHRAVVWIQLNNICESRTPPPYRSKAFLVIIILYNKGVKNKGDGKPLKHIFTCLTVLLTHYG